LILRDEGPCLLFIGEAPGAHEDATGLPFQGSAGRIFNLALSFCTTAFHFDITNIIGCRPTRYSSKTHSYVNRAPSPQEIAACKPRLDQLLSTITYSGVVYLGSVAQAYRVRGIPSLTLVHPAAILRKEYKLYDIKLFAHKLDQYVISNFERR
jgi:DNA polymerase